LFRFLHEFSNCFLCSLSGKCLYGRTIATALTESASTAAFAILKALAALTVASVTIVEVTVANLTIAGVTIVEVTIAAGVASLTVASLTVASLTVASLNVALQTFHSLTVVSHKTVFCKFYIPINKL
jgi:hypothetical protein